MGQIEGFDYKVLSDGWIKVPAEDFRVGSQVSEGGRLMIGLNQLLLRMAGKTVLIDTGLGDKWQPSELDLLDYQRPRRLLRELAAAGIRPEDVGIVILTHLHYDHSGGGTVRRKDSGLAPTFTNAVYYVSQRELEYARHPDPENAGDYRLEDVEPLLDDRRLISVEGELEVLPGLSIHPAPGHSPGHQVVVAECERRTIFFPGDLFATREHANLEVTTAYDYDPGELIRQRRRWLERAGEGQWQCVFCHAIREPVGVI